MKAWQYEYVHQTDRFSAFMEELAQLGRDGWELVAVTGPTCTSDGEDCHVPCAYLKKPIEPKTTTEDGVCL